MASRPNAPKCVPRIHYSYVIISITRLRAAFRFPATHRIRFFKKTQLENLTSLAVLLKWMRERMRAHPLCLEENGFRPLSYPRGWRVSGARAACAGFHCKLKAHWFKRGGGGHSQWVAGTSINIKNKNSIHTYKTDEEVHIWMTPKYWLCICHELAMEFGCFKTIM